MKTTLTAALLIALLASGIWAAEEAEKKEEAPVLKAQTACPVMGGKINKTSFVDHEGQRIYVCCAGCLPPLKKDPAKYIAKLKEAGITLESTPKPEKEKSDE